MDEEREDERCLCERGFEMGDVSQILMDESQELVTSRNDRDAGILISASLEMASSCESSTW